MTHTTTQPERISDDIDSVSLNLKDNLHEAGNTTDVNELHKPDFSLETIGRYCTTRFTELFPTKEAIAANRHLLNPLPGLRMIPGKQWLMIISAFWAWSWDAYDFFSVSLNAATLAKDFDKTVKDITWENGL
ncbi:unnamed protein product [Ambrosiozyma monospora]|uniref:Unnamed protein product n=1 Tax=Ambrosiozyma monospora TaxID=43982 RepID=A0ACB5TQ00_AMBMO|nr:unnamed protein product [Ambrosiozyma monospora]